MRRLLRLTLASLAVAAPAYGQTPVVYRIAVTGTVENGLAPYVARGAPRGGSRRCGRGLSRHRHSRRPDRRRRADLRRGAPRHDPGLRLRQPSGLQRRRADRDLREGDLHATRRRAWAPPPRWTARAIGPRRRWFRRCAPSSARSPRSAVSTRVSPRRWWTKPSRSPAWIAKGQLLTLTSGEARRVGYAKGGGGRRGRAARRDRSRRGTGRHGRAQLG